MLLYILLLYRGFRIALRATSPFEQLSLPALR